MIYLLFLIQLAWSMPQAAKDPIYDELDGLPLAEALLRDGKSAAAKELLVKFPPSGLRTRLLGDAALALGELENARRFFLEATKEESLAEAAWAQLIFVESRSGRNQECAVAGEKAKAKAWIDEARATALLRCLEAARGASIAYESARVREKLPLERVRLLLKLNLPAQAAKLAFAQLELAKNAAEALMLAETLEAGGAKNDAALILEAARLRFPLEPDLSLALGPYYHGKQWRRSTAQAFDRALIAKPEYAEHAAEMHRQYGGIEVSQERNIRIGSERTRVRQKIALAVERERWDLVGAMEANARRVGLTDDDEVNYALAYSLIRSGIQTRAKTYLDKIKDPSMLEKSAKLRREIEKSHL
jgi:hypothetical protein